MDATQIIVLLLGLIVGGMNITTFIGMFKLYFKYINDTKDVENRLKKLELCKQDRIYFDNNGNHYSIEELSKKSGVPIEEIIKEDKKI